MVTTRSKAAQTPGHKRKDSVTSVTHDTKQEKKPAPEKRKATTSSTGNAEAPASKRTKTSPAKKKTDQPDNTQRDEDHRTIIINRAPVLQLWSACVTHFMYPNLSWETCLSAGSAISTICAVVKGRSIGTISEPTDTEEQQKKREEAKKKTSGTEEIEVMQFKLKVKDGRALVGSTDAKGKPGNEELLRKKFGQGEYERVKECFDDSLEGWGKAKDQLNGKAFGFYEKFRPEVKSGEKGWGRKGELSLANVRSVVTH